MAMPAQIVAAVQLAEAMAAKQREKAKVHDLYRTWRLARRRSTSGRVVGPPLARVVLLDALVPCRLRGARGDEDRPAAGRYVQGVPVWSGCALPVDAARLTSHSRLMTVVPDTIVSRSDSTLLS